ncbi:MAG: CoA pyrophosphatase [Armatimonadota bacterium]|nr:CoA pyrophosphatase [Armatimonadota bacterium]MDR7564162.1 CoA pyrophosphatase [Armatimonadota bacterium]MDR7616656.1 CoA pyrophosphatase [Armatimonadota bacterium]
MPVEDPLEPVRSRLSRYVPRRLPEAGLVLAGVLVPLYVDGGEAHVLLTRRTEHVATHKGQIAFPGGAVEPEDRDALHAALREAHEELGIRPEDVEVLGSLDDVSTVVSGFLIRPYVGRLPYPYPLRPAPQEIAEVLGIPLRFFRDERNLRVERVGEGAAQRELHFYDYGPYTVWGATARVIRRLVEVLS